MEIDSFLRPLPIKESAELEQAIDSLFQVYMRHYHAKDLLFSDTERYFVRFANETCFRAISQVQNRRYHQKDEKRDVILALRLLLKNKGGEALTKILGDFGATSVRDLDPRLYSVVAREATKRIGF